MISLPYGNMTISPVRLPGRRWRSVFKIVPTADRSLLSSLQPTENSSFKVCKLPSTTHTLSVRCIYSTSCRDMEEMDKHHRSLSGTKTLEAVTSGDRIIPLLSVAPVTTEPEETQRFTSLTASVSLHALPDVEAIQSAVVDIVSAYYPPLYLEVILRAYTARHRDPLPYGCFGFTNVLEFFNRYMNHLFSFEWSEAGKCIIRVRDTNTVKTRSRPKDPTGSGDENGCLHEERATLDSELAVRRRPVRKNFRAYLVELMSHYPSGVHLKGFLDDFSRLSGSRLDFARYGYRNVTEMIVDLADVFRSLDDLAGQLILFPVNGSTSLKGDPRPNRYRLDNRARPTRDGI